MNKTKIDWCDMSWNPITGCLHGCEYCYARRIAERFGALFKGAQPEDEGLSFLPDEPDRFYELDEPARDETGIIEPYPANFYPTFHRYRLGDPARKTRGRNIFVGSMADVFGDWVPDEWIVQVMDACRKTPQHNYLFLTKNPKRYEDLIQTGLLPCESNFWYGTTATTPDTPYFFSGGHKTFLSVEPMLERFGPDGRIDHMDWVIIGGMTGPGSEKRQPQREWVEEIVENCRKHSIPIFMKNNLEKVWGADLIREFPSELKGR